jgi:hypothetical protein
MRERSGRQDLTERKRPGGLARLASAANATTESGGEAEIAGGVGRRRRAVTRSLRSARGATHSVAARVSVQMESAEGSGENSFVFRLGNASLSGETKYS